MTDFPDAGSGPKGESHRGLPYPSDGRKASTMT